MSRAAQVSSMRIVQDEALDHTRAVCLTIRSVSSRKRSPPPVSRAVRKRNGGRVDTGVNGRILGWVGVVYPPCPRMACFHALEFSDIEHVLSFTSAVVQPVDECVDQKQTCTGMIEVGIMVIRNVSYFCSTILRYGGIKRTSSACECCHSHWVVLVCSLGG